MLVITMRFLNYFKSAFGKDYYTLKYHKNPFIDSLEIVNDIYFV